MSLRVGGMRFNGPEYVPEHDQARLSDQHVRIRELMLDGVWRTLAEIAVKTGFPQASISAQLRHLRKERFGAFVVERRKRGDRAHGLFEYRVRQPELFDEGVKPSGTSRVRQLEARVAELEAELARVRMAAGYGGAM